jgi:hypothetical protein
MYFAFAVVMGTYVGICAFCWIRDYVRMTVQEPEPMGAIEVTRSPIGNPQDV